MKHLKRFNEEFNWSKLNIFSKEDLKKTVDKSGRIEFVSQDEEALAKAIYSEISGKIKGDLLLDIQ